MDLSIIIPVYNEEDNIFPLRDKLNLALEKLDQTYEIVIVNDGSTDATAQRLDELAAEDDRFHVFHLSRNFGQTAAIMAAVDNSTGEIIISMDGDLQNDPEDIPRLLEKLDEGYDVCSGWRVDRKDNPVTRNFPSRLANRLISRMTGVRLHDYGCLLKAYRRSIMKDVKLYGEMHRFIPIYAFWLGAKVTEIPVQHHARQHGESKYGLERTIKVILDLIVVKFLSSYAGKPIYVFGGFGLMSIFASFLCFGLMLVFKFIPDPAWQKDFVETPLPAVVIMLFLMGFLSMLMGLICELQIRTYYESQGKPIYHISESCNRGTKG